jgi:RimJ/RimL family protein N-acetyltransferase
MGNDKIKILPLEEKHFDELSNTINSESLWTYNPKFYCKNKEDVMDYLNKTLLQKNKEERLPFIIHDINLNKIIGTTSFYNISKPNKNTSIGYTVIGVEYLRKGYSYHSKNLMLNWCFYDMDFERVDFHIDNRNKTSILSVKKMGAIEEGVLRSNVELWNGKRRDTAVLSILREEWRNKNKTL